jgi:hypothetical protein
MVAPKDDIGLHPGDVAKLLGCSTRNVWRLRHHADPKVRYPAPDLEIHPGRPLWKMSTHLKWERRQRPGARPVAVHAGDEEAART